MVYKLVKERNIHVKDSSERWKG